MIKFSPLFATVFFAQISLGLLTPLTPIMLIAQGIPTYEIGIVASSYYGGMFGGSFVIPGILSRIGHTRALVIFCVVAADTTLGLHEIKTVAFWIAVRFTTGFASIGVFTVVESWLNAATSRTLRGRTFGVYLLSSWTGSMAGAYLLSVFNSVSILINIVTAGLMTAMLPVTMLTRVGPALPPRFRLALRDLFALSPIGVVTCFTAGFCSSTFYAMFPVFMERMGIHRHGISIVITLCLLAAMSLQFPIGLLADRIGRSRIIIVLIIVATIASLSLIMAGQLVYFAIFGATFGGATGVLYGLGAGQTADRANQEQLIGISSGVLLVWALGACGGPVIAAIAMTWLGSTGVFWGLIVVFLVSPLAVAAGNRLSASRRRGNAAPGPHRVERDKFG